MLSNKTSIILGVSFCSLFDRGSPIPSRNNGKSTRLFSFYLFGRRFTKTNRTMDLKLLGQRLRQIRKHLGITQKMLAEEIGLTQPALSRIENGEEVYASVLVAVLNFYQDKISLDYLFSEEFDVNSDRLVYFVQENVRKLLDHHLAIVEDAITSTHEANLAQIELCRKRLC